jgi:hypothetical protein
VYNSYELIVATPEIAKQPQCYDLVDWNDSLGSLESEILYDESGLGQPIRASHTRADPTMWRWAKIA